MSDEFFLASGDRTATHFNVLEPRFDAVRADCDRLLHLNQEAMRRKADAASATARSEGKTPGSGRLTVDDVTRQDIDVAAAWDAD